MIEPFPGPAPPSRSVSFDELFTEGFTRTVRTLVLMGSDRATAEDLAQEAFGVALKKWDDVGGLDSPLAWVGKTALTLWTSHCRTSGRRRSLLAKAEPLSTSTAPHALTTSDQRIDLVRALEQLPERQRETVVLHYILDQPVSAIARTLEVAEGTVKSQLHDGRRSLRLLMADTDAHPIREGGSSEPHRK